MLILRAIVGISDADTGIDPCFVDIKSTTVELKILNDKKLPPGIYSYKTDSDWSSGEIESTSEEISLRATVMRHSLMP